MTSTVRLILLDLDDTIFDHATAAANGLRAHRKSLGGAFASADDTIELERWRTLEEVEYHRYLSGDVDYLGQRRRRVRGFVKPYGIDLPTNDLADEWFAGYFAEYERSWIVFDDVVSALDQLEEAIPGVKFGIVTNGELLTQRRKVDRIGLGTRFERIIASSEVGAAKPDSRIFLAACQRFAIDPAQAVYVGDRLTTDAQGAANAGLRGIWLDREGTASPTDLASADEAGISVIRSLADLPALFVDHRE